MQHAARLPLLLLLAVLAGVTLPPLASGQGAETEARALLARLDSAEAARWDGVRAMRQTLRTGPVTMTIQHRITRRNGEPRFEWRITDVQAAFPIDVEELGGELPTGFVGEPPAWASVLADEMSLETAEADDAAVRRIVLVRPVLPEKLAGQFTLDEPAVEATLERLVLVVDTDQWVLRAIEAKGVITNLETARSGSYRQLLRMEDYREVEGLQIPWKTLMRMELPAQVMMPAGIDPEKLKRQIEEMRDIAAALSPEERAMLEAMLEMSDFFADDGVMEVSAEVVSVEVRRER